jgi:hypothetical protein
MESVDEQSNGKKREKDEREFHIVFERARLPAVPQHHANQERCGF